MREQYLKRALDIICSIISLALLSPIFILISILIIMEGLFNPSTKGPVIHPELRISKGEVFKTLKFRSVKVEFLEPVKKDPEAQTVSLIMYDFPESLTRVGRFLAKYYLDELPQLFNILKGDMSFVGPRPQPPASYRKRVAMGDLSLKYIKGGLFGLCQACKRSAKMQQAIIDSFRQKNTSTKITYLDDIYFIKHKSYSPLKLLFYDVRVAFATIRTSLLGGGLAPHKKNLGQIKNP